MNHQIISINEYKIELDYSVLGTLKSFKEEVLDELHNLNKLHGEMPVLFSGGMDSTFIIRSLMELGLKPKTISFSFSKNNDDYECELVKSKCKKYGLEPPEFFHIDKKAFFDHLDYLLRERDTAYPMLHGFFMDYFLKSNKHGRFYSGINCEFKLMNGKVYMPPGPILVRQNNPGQLYGFATDRTFLSYFKEKIFVDNYKKPFPMLNGDRVDSWYVRDLIYMDCYPDMDREPKDIPNPWRAHIKEPFYNEVVPYLKNRFPLLYHDKVGIKPCEFDLDFLVNL